MLRRPEGVVPTLVAVAGQDRPLPLLAFIVAATFPDDVVELRASATNSRAHLLRGGKRFSADLGGLEDAGGDVAALCRRRARVRAKTAPLDAASAKLQRRLTNPSASRRPGRPPKERPANTPRRFGGRGLEEFFNVIAAAVYSAVCGEVAQTRTVQRSSV